MEGSTVVAIDISLGLAMRGQWELCKESATAALDAMRQRWGVEPLVVAYNESARWLDVSTLSGLDYEAVYGVNVQHAVEMARHALDGAAGERRILFVADDEPDSYSRVDGSVHFGYPPDQETARITLNEARYCHLAGIRCDFLLLNEESPFRATATKMANECGGSVGFVSEGERVNESVQSFLQEVGII